MFKLVVLSFLFAVAAARPSIIGSPLIYSSPVVHEPVLTRVGAVVKSVPTAVSHQSQSVVHSRANVIEDVVAPVVRSYSAAPVYHSYSSPLAHSYETPYASYPYASPYTSSSYSTGPLSYGTAGLW